jgi:hypothetical protein
VSSTGFGGVRRMGHGYGSDPPWDSFGVKTSQKVPDAKFSVDSAIAHNGLSGNCLIRGLHIVEAKVYHTI